MKRSLIAILCLFFLSPPILWSQDGVEASVRVPRRLVLFVESRGKILRNDQLLLYESLLVKLHTAGPEVAVFEAPDVANPPDTDEKMSEVTDLLGGDAWLHVILKGSVDDLSIRARSFDLVKGAQVFAISFERKDRRDLERLFWKDVVDAVAESYDSLVQEIVGEVKNRADLTITGVPNTEVFGFGDEIITLDDQGSAVVPVLEEVAYSLEARAEGYYPLDKQIYVASPVESLNLDQKKASRFTAEVYLNNLTYPGLAGSVYILPNTLFLRLGLTTYAVGMPRNIDDDIPNGFPLTHVNLSGGYYFNPVGDFFRFYGAIGVFIRLNHIPEKYFGIDALAPFGMHFIAGAEASQWMRVRPFLEFRPLLYFLSDHFLAQSAYYQTTGENWNYGGSGNVVIDAGQVHLGIRFLL